MVSLKKVSAACSSRGDYAIFRLCHAHLLENTACTSRA